MDKKNWHPVTDMRYAKTVIGALVVFLAIFLFLGNVRNGGKSDWALSLSTYIGSSIVALDKYVSHNGLGVSSRYFGEYTQYLLYQVLNAFHFSDKQAVSVMPLVYIDNSNHFTNIYTALGRYLHDYSLAGTMIIEFVIGFIYSKLFKNLRLNIANGRDIILFSFMSYPLVEMSIEERFISNLLSARSVYCIIYIFLIYKFLLKKPNTYSSEEYNG